MSPWVARVPPVLVLAVVLHTAVFPQLRVFDTAADVLVVLAVAAAVAAGPARGAIVGCLCGFLADCFLQTPFGLSALVLAPVAYGVGVFQTRIHHVVRWLPVVAAAAAAGTAVIAYAIVGAMLGEDHLISSRLFVVVPVVAVVGGMLSPVAVRIMRWALDVDPRGPVVLR